MYVDPNQTRMRKFRAKDTAVVEGILRRCFLPGVADRFSQELANRKVTGVTFMVADYEGMVVGVVAYFAGKTPGELYVSCVAVCPHFQFRGVGRMMVEWLKSRLGEMGLTSIGLHVHAADKIPQHLYSSCGFETIETVDNFYLDGGSAHHMRYRPS